MSTDTPPTRQWDPDLEHWVYTNPSPGPKKHTLRKIILSGIGAIVFLIILANLGGGSTPPPAPAPVPASAPSVSAPPVTPAPVTTVPPTTTTTVPPTTTTDDQAPVETTTVPDNSDNDVNVPNVHVPHPHARVCVGGRHVHVCS